MPGRTGAALFKPASCRRIDYSAKRLSERTLLIDKNDVAAGINRASGPAAMSDDFYDLSSMDARQALFLKERGHGWPIYAWPVKNE
jgi:hypothetical protein